MFHGYVTNEGSVLIIGTDEQKVKDALKDNGLSEPNVKDQKLYKFKHENGNTTFGNPEKPTKYFGRLTQYEETVQKEVDAMEEALKVYPDRINDFLGSLQ